MVEFIINTKAIIPLTMYEYNKFQNVVCRVQKFHKAKSQTTKQKRTESSETEKAEKWTKMLSLSSRIVRPLSTPSRLLSSLSLNDLTYEPGSRHSVSYRSYSGIILDKRGLSFVVVLGKRVHYFLLYVSYDTDDTI